MEQFSKSSYCRSIEGLRSVFKLKYGPLADLMGVGGVGHQVLAGSQRYSYQTKVDNKEIELIVATVFVFFAFYGIPFL